VRTLHVAGDVRATRVENEAELSEQESLEPHSIKIDRSLILGLLDTDEGTAIIEALLARRRL
jgi:EAL domain-containing protein (putative c-di-GMP-specific phosphodiesterase class I)